MLSCSVREQHREQRTRQPAPALLRVHDDIEQVELVGGLPREQETAGWRLRRYTRDPQLGPLASELGGRVHLGVSEGAELADAPYVARSGQDDVHGGELP